MAESEQPAESSEKPGATILAFPTLRRPEPEETADQRPLLRTVLGKVLRDERLAQGRTLADVAEEAAVSLPYLSEIERGTKEVSSDLLDAVIRSLDLDLTEVLERSARRLRVRSQRSGSTLLLAA